MAGVLPQAGGDEVADAVHLELELLDVSDRFHSESEGPQGETDCVDDTQGPNGGRAQSKEEGQERDVDLKRKREGQEPTMALPGGV